jgi:putative methyltransferase (TIGR04325 family)
MASVIDKETFIECESWSHAEQNSSGYSSQDTIDLYEKLNTTSKDTKRNEFLSPRHTELFCAIQRSINDEDSISVADMGGGNGYLGFDAIKFFGDSLNWTVFETQGFADIYNSPQQGKVRFERIDQYLPNRKFSISLFSCSLQYMKNCYEMLQRSLENSSYVILSRLPVLDCQQDKTTIQNVSLDGKNFS